MSKTFNTGYLKRTLKTRGITQAVLANETGIQISTLSKIIRGVVKTPRRKTVMRIAHVLKIEPESLWTEKTVLTTLQVADAPPNTTSPQTMNTAPTADHQSPHTIFQRIGDLTLADGSILLKSRNGVVYVAKELDV